MEEGITSGNLLTLRLANRVETLLARTLKESSVHGRGTLWEWYCLQLCEQIRQLAEQGRTMPVSIETLVTASHMDGDIEVMDEFIVLGVTILGINVTPAVAGARITALRALEGEFAELKIRAASYNGEVNPAEPGTEPNPEQKPVGDPPTATNEKGGNRALILNKKQLAKLNERFQGYVVLAASQNDDSGEMTVKLRNDAFEAFTYKMANNEETVAPERIVPTMMSVNLGDEFTVDATDLFDALYGANTKLNSEKDTVSKELEAARAASFLKESGVAIVNTQVIWPMPVITGIKFGQMKSAITWRLK